MPGCKAHTAAAGHLLVTILHKIAIIVAGGSGKRAGTPIPKQFCDLDGKAVLEHSIETMHRAGAELIIVVLHSDYLEEWTERLGRLPYNIVTVAGGATRPESVKNALSEAQRRGCQADDLIAVHDGARPLLPLKVAEEGWRVATEHGAAVPVVMPTDSLRRITANGSEAVARADYRCVQTPQVFRAELLMRACDRPDTDRFTDDASLVECIYPHITLFDGSVENMKITNPGDLEIAAILLKHRS